MVLAIKNYILPDNTQAWTSVYVFQPHFICPYPSPTSSPPPKLQSVALKVTLIRIKQMAKTILIQDYRLHILTLRHKPTVKQC